MAAPVNKILTNPDRTSKTLITLREIATEDVIAFVNRPAVPSVSCRSADPRSVIFS